MKNSTLVSYLSQFMEITEEEADLISQQNIVKSFQAGEVLLKEGDTASECYLVLEGCVRSYYLLDGNDRTATFYTENEPIVPISYINNSPSPHYLECLEDCLLSIGNEDKTQAFLTEYPRFAPLIGKISNQLLADRQQALDQFKNLSPEQRYLKLLETRPDLMARVPQYNLASYLGITPQSLSRIRKRLESGDS